MKELPRIAVLGASGLIGNALAHDLMQRGFDVYAFARRFTVAQKLALCESFIEMPLVAESAELIRALDDADIIVNCIGVLQDGPGGTTEEVHRAFTATLVEYCATPPRKLLVHLSVPGRIDDDTTRFSRTKHAAEQIIAESAAPYAILRPGFVFAPGAYGGSAMLRAFAEMPFRLSRRDSEVTFAVVAMSDVCETVALVARRWRVGEFDWRESWDVMEDNPGTLGAVIELLRGRAGGPPPIFRLSGWLLTSGGYASDVVALLGWKLPTRTTAIREMRRGVTGDPRQWIERTGLEPLPAKAAISLVPFTVQEKWFARLYFLKALGIVSLSTFWCVSGLLALSVSFDSAAAVFTGHGFSFAVASVLTVTASIVDIVIGCAIAIRRTCRLGLTAGIAVSLGYMSGAVLFAPDLWLEPLGPLVKTVPLVILMLIALVMLEDR